MIKIGFIALLLIGQRIHDNFDHVAKEISRIIADEATGESVRVFVPNFPSREKGATKLGIHLAEKFTGSLTRYRENFMVVNPEIGEDAVKEQMPYFILRNESEELTRLLDQFKCHYLIYAPFLFDGEVIDFPAGIIVQCNPLITEAGAIGSCRPFRLRVYQNLIEPYKNLYYPIKELLEGDSLLNCAQTAPDPSMALELFSLAYKRWTGIGDYADVRERISQLKGELEGFLNKIRLTRVSEEKLTGITGSGLGNPIVVKASYNERGVSGLPIKFDFLEGKGIVDTLIITDKDGQASAVIHRLDSHGRTVIRCCLNEIFGISSMVRPLEFEIEVLKRRCDLRIAIWYRGWDLADYFVDRLKKAGFINAYKDSASQNADLRIIIQASTSYHGEMEGIYCVSASGSITIYDSEDQVFYSTNAYSGRVYNLSRRSGSGRAIAEVRSILWRRLIARLRERFPG